LNNGLEQVRAILGPEDSSGFSDNFIKNALWDNWFDVERTVDYLLGMSSSISSFVVLKSVAEEHARQLLAEERRGELYSLLYFFLSSTLFNPLFAVLSPILRYNPWYVIQVWKSEEKVHACIILFAACLPRMKPHVHFCIPREKLR
jgi:hypothetical protein